MCMRNVAKKIVQEKLRCERIATWVDRKREFVKIKLKVRKSQRKL